MFWAVLPPIIRST